MATVVKKAAFAILMWMPALASAVQLEGSSDDHWEMLKASQKVSGIVD